MKVISFLQNTARSVGILVFSSLIMVLFFAFGCPGENDDDDDNDGFTAGPCTSTMDFDDLNLNEFEVTGTDDCAAAGIDVEIHTFHYSQWRMEFEGTGVYSSENGPHYAYSLDENEAICFIELTEGEFRFARRSTWCDPSLTFHIYYEPPIVLDAKLDDISCTLQIKPTAEGLEHCGESPD